MHLSDACVIVSTCDVAAICTWSLTCTLKIIWHTSWVFRRILSKWPHYRGHAKCNHMQSCSWNLSLSHLGVASSPEYYGCVILSYTRPTRASADPQATRISLRPSLVKQAICSNVWRLVELLVSCSPWSPCSSYCAHLHSSSLGEVALYLCTYNMHEVPLILILTSLLTQPSNLISLLTHARWIFILISFLCS